jgi:hypothetical protein
MTLRSSEDRSLSPSPPSPPHRDQVDVMRSEGRVKLLNFAYLSLDKKKMLGCGSYSKVYRGKYRGTPVAIKLLFTVDLNPEIIRRCCTEAQLLSDVSHPNVVEIFGVSVLPPRSPQSRCLYPHLPPPQRLHRVGDLSVWLPLGCHSRVFWWWCLSSPIAPVPCRSDVLGFGMRSRTPSSSLPRPSPLPP